MPILPRHDHDDGPPTPSEYVVLLCILVAGAIGYMFFRNRHSLTSFAMDDLRGVRLSEDGPSPESFLTTSGSSESLPAHMEDVPFEGDPLESISRKSFSGERFPTRDITPPAQPASDVVGMREWSDSGSEHSEDEVAGENIVFILED